MLDNSAKTLGLTFPITLLDRADEVIERLADQCPVSGEQWTWRGWPVQFATKFQLAINLKTAKGGLKLAHIGWHHGIDWVLDEGHPHDAGGDLLEQLQPFHGDHWLIVREAGDIAARPRQAGDNTEGYRIGNEREHDRYRPGRLLQRPRSGRCSARDDVGRHRNQLGRMAAHLFGG